MNSDARISISFPRHPKTKRLQRELGAEGIWCLIQLWLWTAEHRPSGYFGGLEPGEIEDGANWIGEPGKLISTLLEIGFLEAGGGSPSDQGVSGLRVRGWEEHNAYAAHAPHRAAAASYAAKFRHLKGDMRVASADLKKRNESAYAPSPAPSPYPLKEESKALVLVADAPSTPGGTQDCPHDEIIAAYHRLLPMLPRVREWTEARRSKLRMRWRERDKRQSLEFWEKFFAYVAKSDFLCGRSDAMNGRKVFLADLEWLLTSANFVKVIEGKYQNAAAPGQAEEADRAHANH